MAYVIKTVQDEEDLFIHKIKGPKNTPFYTVSKDHAMTFDLMGGAEKVYGKLKERAAMIEKEVGIRDFYGFLSIEEF